MRHGLVAFNILQINKKLGYFFAIVGKKSLHICTGSIIDANADHMITGITDLF